MLTRHDSRDMCLFHNEIQGCSKRTMRCAPRNPANYGGESGAGDCGAPVCGL